MLCCNYSVTVTETIINTFNIMDFGQYKLKEFDLKSEASRM